MSNVSLQHEAPLTVLRRSPAFVRVARFERRRGAPLLEREQAEVVRIFAAFASSANPLLRQTYASVIQAAAAPATRAMLNRVWEAKERKIEELIRNEGKAEGEAAGRARGKAEMLLRLFSADPDLPDLAAARWIVARSISNGKWFVPDGDILMVAVKSRAGEPVEALRGCAISWSATAQ